MPFMSIPKSERMGVALGMCQEAATCGVHSVSVPMAVSSTAVLCSVDRPWAVLTNMTDPSVRKYLK